jgi:hypothetical protein
MNYLAIPYSSNDPFEVVERYDISNMVAAHLMKRGRFVVAPISHWHIIAHIYDLPKDALFWSDYNKHLLSLCDGLIVVTLKGWDASIGVQQEIEWARADKKQIEYFNPYTMRIGLIEREE